MGALFPARPSRAAEPRREPSVIVPLNLPASASRVELLAARELARYLAQLHRDAAFPIRSAGGIHPGEIHLGRSGIYPEVQNWCDPARLEVPESFLVTTVKVQGVETAIIAGADAPGVLHGVYALLEQLGGGFYLSEETVPRADGRKFSFAGWELADAPLFRRRIVFNWHNFLSGCTAWNLPQWQQWIVQSQKMRYNTILVHAYGNSPLTGFSFRGVPKEVGFLATTVRGRDWGTAHVNDVRRLRGGSVFPGPVFGAAAAQVPAGEREDAAQRLMQSVFRFAADRGMGVWFALDIDTTAAQPPAIIERLPLPARFEIHVARSNTVQGAVAGALWLANPDTADGYAYYRAQAAALLDLYPEIGGLALWIRVKGSPWLAMTPDQFPPSWSREYAAEIARTPEAAQLGEAPGRFALGKIVAAWQRALRELGRGDIELAAGSWRGEWLEASHRFFPAGVTFLPLDYDVGNDKSEFDAPERRARTRRVARERPVIPIAWAQHDDAHFIGRSYTPWANFADKLTEMGAAGFGIIHWTTRPLDLYFKSLGQQVWRRSRNETLDTTCRQMADRQFPGEANGLLREYLRQWIAAAPIFGSASTSRFFVERLPAGRMEAIVAGCRERLNLLERAGAMPMSPESRRRLEYYRDLEHFSALCFESERALQTSVDQFLQHDYATATRTIARSRPEEAIEFYARAAGHGDITRGEQGVIIGLNLGWLSYHENQRQALRVSAVRFDFGPTQSERLAQAAGTMSFAIDAQQRLWRKMDASPAPPFELGADDDVELPPGTDPAWAEMCRDGIEIARPLTLPLGPLLFDATSLFASAPPVAQVLMPGSYVVRLLILHAPAASGEETRFNVEVVPGRQEGAQSLPVAESPVTLPAQGPARPRLHEITRMVTLDSAGKLEVIIRPVAGTVRLCALVIEPAGR